MQFQPLPYTNFMQLIDAAAKGVKFEVVTVRRGRVVRTEQVTRIVEHELRANAVSVKVTTPHSFGYGYFRPDGSNYEDPSYVLRIVQEVAAPAEPFLKQFVNGTPAYNPKTRETVQEVAFVNGAIQVLLKTEDDKWRISTNYDHEGRHRWVKERSLVLGDLPPKPAVMKDVTLEVFNATTSPGKFIAFEAGSHNRRPETRIATVTVKVPA